MTETAFDQILLLKDRATQQSDQIGHHLSEGIPPERLVSLLQIQTETIGQLQTLLVNFAQKDNLNTHREDIQNLKKTLQNLMQAAEQHVQKATQKGMRLTGIGGKPYVPKRRPKAP